MVLCALNWAIADYPSFWCLLTSKARAASLAMLHFPAKRKETILQRWSAWKNNSSSGYGYLTILIIIVRESHSDRIWSAGVRWIFIPLQHTDHFPMFIHSPFVRRNFICQPTTSYIVPSAGPGAKQVAFWQDLSLWAVRMKVCFLF